MLIKIWGVRGSIPTPQTADAIRSKISTVLQRVRPEDLRDARSRELFLATLPTWLFGTTGGNTACIEIRAGDEELVILDAGSGMRELGVALQREQRRYREYHVFFSHYHWDHLQGLPFFGPVYDGTSIMHYYGAVDDLETILRAQMNDPYFPVELDIAAERSRFHRLGGGRLTIGPLVVRWKRMNHPGGCVAYRIDHGQRSFIYATDSELITLDFERSAENIEFFEGVDMMVLDSQYTLGEAVEKYNWGHSSFSLAVDFATEWKIGMLHLFHHEPAYDDKKLFSNLQSARWYASHLGKWIPEIHLATEGDEIEL